LIVAESDVLEAVAVIGAALAEVSAELGATV
jgi:hypothetical protein